MWPLISADIWIVSKKWKGLERHSRVSGQAPHCSGGSVWHPTWPFPSGDFTDVLVCPLPSGLGGSASRLCRDPVGPASLSWAAAEGPQHVGGSRPQPRASLRARAPGVLHARWPLSSGEARTCLVRVIVGVLSHVTLSSGCWLCVYRGARARRWEEVALQAWKVTPPVASPPSRAGLPSCGFAESLASQRLGFPAHELVSPVTTGVLPAPFRCGCLFRLAAWLPGESRIPVSFPIWGKLSGFPGSVMFAMGVSRCLLSH